MQNGLVKMRKYAYHYRKMFISYYIGIAPGALNTDDAATANFEFSQGRWGGDIYVNMLIHLIANPVLAFIYRAFKAEVVRIKNERKQHHLRRDSQIIECLRSHFPQDGNADLVT